MTRAAIRAGMIDQSNQSSLLIILEPEAASMFVMLQDERNQGKLARERMYVSQFFILLSE